MTSTLQLLSRAPTSQSTPSDDQFCCHVDSFVHLVTGGLPVTDEHLQQISRLQDECEMCQQLKQYCLNGWPETCKIKGLLKLYRHVSSEIEIQDGLLMRNNNHHPNSFCDKSSWTRSIPITRASTSAEKRHSSLFGGQESADS